MISPLLRSVVSARRNVKVDAPPAVAFDPKTLFGSTDDGIFLRPGVTGSAFQTRSGKTQTPASADGDLVYTAIGVERDLALGQELIPDPDLFGASGWSGIVSPWSHDAAGGRFVLTNAPSAGGTLACYPGASPKSIYQLITTVDTRTAGNLQTRFGSGSVVIANGDIGSTAATVTMNLIPDLADGADARLGFRIGATGANLSLSQVSLKRYLSRAAMTTSDAERPTLKSEGAVWWLENLGGKSLKLVGDALTGCTICYATEDGVELFENQDIGAGYELLKGERTYGVLVINRTLSAQQKTGLQALFGQLITGEIDITPEPPGDPSPTWANLGTTTKTSFYSRIDSATSHTFKATGANAATHEWESVGAPSGVTVNLTTAGLTAPFTIEIEGAALDDASTTHFSIGTNDLTGAFPPVSNMTALRELYMARNLKTAPIKSIGALPSLEVFYAFNNGATGWESTVIPASMRDLKLYGNAFNQATVDAILTQANTAQMGVGCTVDLTGNASPSSAGWTTRDALVARGCAVNVSGEDPRVNVPTTMKWFPGHYVFIGGRSRVFMATDPDELIASYEQYKDYPIVQGVQVRYVWRELEPTTKGNYRFDKVISDANWLQARGKKLIIQLQHKTFAAGQKVVPPYMENAEHEGGHFQIGGSMAGGWMMNSWNPKVQAGHSALIAALGAAVDSHPAIVCVNINESAVTPDKLSDAYVNWTQKQEATKNYLNSLPQKLRAAFPKTPTVQYMNSPDSWMPGAEAQNRATGNGHGCPDTVPTAWEYGQTIRTAYEMTIRLQGLVPILYSVQWRNYYNWEKGPTAGIPVVVEDLFEFQRDVLKSNFCTWLQRNRPDGETFGFWPDVKALWADLPTRYPDDPAGGLVSAFPTLLKQ